MKRPYYIVSLPYRDKEWYVQDRDKAEAMQQDLHKSFYAVSLMEVSVSPVTGNDCYCNLKTLYNSEVN